MVELNPNASRKNRFDRRRAESEQQMIMYSWKFIKRVSTLRRADSADATVRAAADRILVDSAKGKTHWSRAVLNRHLKKKRRAPEPMIRKNKLHRKVRALSRLVPGCRKLSLPSLLEETADYIAALEMQVKAMALLTVLVNGAVLCASDYVTSSTFRMCILY